MKIEELKKAVKNMYDTHKGFHEETHDRFDLGCAIAYTHVLKLLGEYETKN